MIILTFDLEDWFHILDCPQTKTEQEWKQYRPRIHANTDRLLSLLDEKGRKATFFCLGWIAREFPGVIRSISDAGHDIASHSMMHQLVYTQSRNSFRSDVAQSISLLEDLTGKAVRAYRAPGFSITRDTLWAFDILHDLGITVDCSVFPLSHNHGGFPGLEVSGPFVLEQHGYRLKMFPMSYVKLGFKRLVVSGGGYFRLMPWYLISRFLRKEGYFMTYFHPKDFDPDQPKIPGLTAARHFKTYVGLKSSYGKLAKLLDEPGCCDLETALDRTDWKNVPVLELTRERNLEKQMGKIKG